MSAPTETPGPAEPDTPLQHPGTEPEATPRIPDAPTPSTSAPQTRYPTVGQVSEWVPEGVANYFGGKSGDTDVTSANGAERDDETASTGTDLTELSTAAQAGSLAPSGPASPRSSASALSVDADDGELEKRELDERSPRTRDYGEEPADAEAEADAKRSPFLDEPHADASMPTPPQLNLAPRTHPLAAGDAQHGGVLLREDVQAQMDAERAEGTLSPAYDGVGPHAESATREEDDYSSDEGGAEQGEGGVKRLVRKVKGEAKVLSGQIRRDPERVEEGKKMKAA
ncbi:hypothetical protein FB451DRAFT_1370377 [Mycena latifolia]|nr:hypothetical protein FB451DRAFT_1370377 [Mycena latifolia]